MKIREATTDDWPHIWPFFRAICVEGETFVYPYEPSEEEGRALGEYTLAWARAQGYRAMQFNAVAESNARAVHLWRAIGFEIIGTVPEAFHSPTHGYVGLHVMYQKLD